MSNRYVLVSFCRYLNTTDNLLSKWFYTKTKIKHPKTKFITFKTDWDEKVGLDIRKSTPLRAVSDLEEYHKLPEILKKMYTYNYVHNQTAVDDEVMNKVTKLGIDKVNHPLAYKIIADSVFIRDKKEFLLTNNKALMHKKQVETMIHNRKINLQKLMMEDGELAKKVIAEFELKPVKPQPRKYCPLNPKYEQTILQTRRTRAMKMKSLREDLSQSKGKFLKKKNIMLDEIRTNLEKINIPIEDALKEVIDERKDQLMNVFYAEKDWWFENEKRLKVKVAKELADKLAAREKQIRR